MTATHPLARPLAALLLIPFGLWVQAAPLNDTGQTNCYDINTNAVANCSTATGSQDGRYGRDAAHQVSPLLPPKVGAGAAGFDFTALDVSGTATAPGTHECVKDNVTGLIWSTETLGAMTWDAANTAAISYHRCGYTSGWRLPTVRELLSIVHRGIASGAAIDGTYFPDTQAGYADMYWTANAYAPASARAWQVGFTYGGTHASDKTDPYHRSYVRLVRSEQ
ncbi:DUF1566 domain-containing protein [Ottowia sp.]|uniref:Lcl C-terminal domain-containing protein n=1 Tax=Ottowia sp. TaxID=1898956 RepID=UPI0039E42800